MISETVKKRNAAIAGPYIIELKAEARECLDVFSQRLKALPSTTAANKLEYLKLLADDLRLFEGKTSQLFYDQQRYDSLSNEVQIEIGRLVALTGQGKNEKEK